MTRTVRAHAGELVTARYTSFMVASPLRMSPCGWSSLDSPSIASRNSGGSTYETAGRVPAAASARNSAYPWLIPAYFSPHSPRNGRSWK